MCTSQHRRLAFGVVLGLGALAGAGPGGGRPLAESVAQVVAAAKTSPTTVREFRYRMAAKVRPLLFWIGRDNVGGARVVLARGPGPARCYELLIGSDPERAPWRVNRWGYMREEVRGDEGAMFGAMKESDEESLADAKATAASGATGGSVFKLIRATVKDRQTEAVVTTARSARDFTYRDLAALVESSEQSGITSPSRELRVPDGASVGFLSALTDLVHADVEAYRRSGWTLRAQRTRRAVFVYNARLYDLTLESSRLRDRREVDGRSYTRVVEAEFRSGRTGSSGERFVLWYPADGSLAEVPVFISYQPRWWFKAELVLDDHERF